MAKGPKTFAGELKKQVELWKRHNKDDPTLADQIPGLHFADIRGVAASELATLTPFTKLKMLEVGFCGLDSLADLPDFPELEGLSLTDNLLKDDDLKVLAANRYPLLKALDLSNNNLDSMTDFIKTFSASAFASSLQHLHLGSEDKCPFKTPGSEEDAADWRAKIFAVFPNLKSLDGTDKSGEDVIQSDDDGESLDEEMLAAMFEEDGDSVPSDGDSVAPEDAAEDDGKAAEEGRENPPAKRRRTD